MKFNWTHIKFIFELHNDITLKSRFFIGTSKNLAKFHSIIFQCKNYKSHLCKSMLKNEIYFCYGPFSAMDCDMALPKWLP